MAPEGKALATESEDLRTELLENILQTTRTFIELTEMSMLEGNSPHSMEGLRHVQQGLGNIRKGLRTISSPSKQASISERLAVLEQRAARLSEDFAGKEA